MKGILKGRFVIAGLILAAAFFELFALTFAVPVIAADGQAPVLTLELAIVHGKLSTPREKREVSKARLVLDDEREHQINLRLPIAYSTTSAGGTQTFFIDGATPSFIVTSKPMPGGVELLVHVSYRVPAPVPEAFTAVASAAVSPKTAIRSFDVSTRVALQAQEGARMEIGSIEDPVTDRAWSAIITVVGVKGVISSGVLPKNTTFTVKVEEGDGKAATTTTAILRVATSDVTRESWISDKFHIPYATISASGTQVQFIDFPVTFAVNKESKEPSLSNVSLWIARQHGSGKEPWPVFETSYKAMLAVGAPADLGFVSDGGRTVHATIEQTE